MQLLQYNANVQKKSMRRKHTAGKCNTTIGLESSAADVKFYSPKIFKAKLGKSVPQFFRIRTYIMCPTFVRIGQNL